MGCSSDVENIIYHPDNSVDLYEMFDGDKLLQLFDEHLENGMTLLQIFLAIWSRFYYLGPMNLFPIMFPQI